MELLPQTLVLAFSPCLFYGHKELREKCRASDSEILWVEAEGALKDLEERVIKERALNERLFSFGQNAAKSLDDFFRASSKKFKRVVRLDFSAGVSFNESFYKNFFEAAQNIAAAFWKNRLTLVRLGRLYSQNLFKNLEAAASCVPFEALEKSVKKQIVVCGAGESLDQLTGAAKKMGGDFLESFKRNFFVIAVDAALPALLSAGIKIDAAVATESQLAIEKAYIGIKKSGEANKGFESQKPDEPFFFFDLTSRPQIARRFKNKSFYFSAFDQNAFLGRLQEQGLLPYTAPPLGSVGLTAAYLAMKLRKDSGVPIYVTGLDFSFSAGRTHAKGTAQSKARFLSAGRLNATENFRAAYSPGSQKILGKGQKEIWTSKNLLGYALLFRQFFEGAQNLFDVGNCGIDLGLERKDFDQIIFKGQDRGKDFGQNLDSFFAAAGQGFEGGKNKERIEKCRAFLESELKELKDLADLLSNGEKSAGRDKSLSLDNQILSALKGREYLFLHFPDGTEAKAERSFLARVRSQIDFFAKDIETALTASTLRPRLT